VLETGRGVLETGWGVLETGWGCARQRVGCARNRVGCARNWVGCARNRAGCAREPAGCLRHSAGCAGNPTGCARNLSGVLETRRDELETESVAQRTQMLEEFINTLTAFGVESVDHLFAQAFASQLAPGHRLLCPRLRRPETPSASSQGKPALAIGFGLEAQRNSIGFEPRQTCLGHVLSNFP